MAEATVTAVPTPAAGKKRKNEDAAVAVADAKKARTAPPAGSSANLFVGSLSWNVDSDWLRSEFEKYGEIVRANVVTDRESGRSRGCAAFSLWLQDRL